MKVSQLFQEKFSNFPPLPQKRISKIAAKTISDDMKLNIMVEFQKNT